MKHHEYVPILTDPHSFNHITWLHVSIFSFVSRLRKIGRIVFAFSNLYQTHTSPSILTVFDRKQVNCLPDDNKFDRFELKGFADDKLIVTKNLNLSLQG